MITTYYKNTVMDNLFHTTAATTLPSKYYFSWSPTTVTDNGAGFTEPLASTGYARTEFTKPSVSADGMVCNSQRLEFPESNAGQGMTMVYGLYDAPSNGNLLIYEIIDPADKKTIDKGTTLYIKPGEAKFTLKGM